MSFYKEFEDLKNQLDNMGYDTFIPKLKIETTE
jgi:hypothetical protein